MVAENRWYSWICQSVTFCRLKTPFYGFVQPITLQLLLHYFLFSYSPKSRQGLWLTNKTNMRWCKANGCKSWDWTARWSIPFSTPKLTKSDDQGPRRSICPPFPTHIITNTIKIDQIYLVHADVSSSQDRSVPKFHPCWAIKFTRNVPPAAAAAAFASALRIGGTGMQLAIEMGNNNVDWVLSLSETAKRCHLLRTTTLTYASEFVLPIHCLRNQSPARINI